MAFQRTMVGRGPISRRIVLAAMPAGVLAGATASRALAQPAAPDPVSFYLGQVLALATLQAWSIRRLRALLINPNPGATAWQAGTSEEAGVIGAVAAVLGAMEPPPQLSTSVEELRLASAAYRSAADASRTAAAGDGAALELAAAGLTEGAAHTLLWLDALTATTGNDWGDGLRTLVEEAVPALVEDAQAQLADTQPVAEVAVAQALATPTPAAPVAAAPGNRQNRQARQNRQNRQARQNRRERANQPNQNAPE